MSEYEILKEQNDKMFAEAIRKLDVIVASVERVKKEAYQVEDLVRELIKGRQCSQ